MTHASDRVLRLFVETIEDYAILLLDPAGNVVSWNRGAERTFGWQHEEIFGRPFAGFATEEDRSAEKPRVLLERALAGGHANDEGWRVRKDGARFWASEVV